jgi:hypothetical protein
MVTCGKAPPLVRHTEGDGEGNGPGGRFGSRSGAQGRGPGARAAAYGALYPVSVSAGETSKASASSRPPGSSSPFGAGLPLTGTERLLSVSAPRGLLWYPARWARMAASLAMSRRQQSPREAQRIRIAARPSTILRIDPGTIPVGSARHAGRSSRPSAVSVRTGMRRRAWATVFTPAPMRLLVVSRRKAWRGGL